MTTNAGTIQSVLAELVAANPGTTRILIIGTQSHSIIDALELQGNVTVAHLVPPNDPAASQKWEYGNRPRHSGSDSLGSKKFDLAAFFSGFSEYLYPERHVLSLLSSHASVLLFGDGQALAPDSNQFDGNLAQVNPWIKRRKLFLTRLMNDLGLLDVRWEKIDPKEGPCGVTREEILCLGQRGKYRPLLVHVHIPKTAGISIRQTLERSFPDAVLPISHWGHKGNAGNTTTVHSLLIEHPHLQAIGSHLFRFNYPTIVGDRVMLYFTLLRNPVEQFKSQVRFLKYNTGIFRKMGESASADRWEAMSMLEIAGELMGQTQSARPDLDTRPFMPCRFLGLTDQADPVIRKLMGFVLVGLCERMQDSLELLRHKLAPYELNLQVDNLPHLNRSKGANYTGEPLPEDHATQEAALESDESIDDFVKTHHAADLTVYEWATANFETQWEKFKGLRSS